MLVMRTIEDPTDPVGKLVSAQESVGFDHLPLAVYPFGLDGVQPRILLGQQTAYDPHPLAALLDSAIMSSEPAPELPGDMPTCVVPDQEQDLLAYSFELLATPGEELGRYGTHGPPIHESQPCLIKLGQVESVTRDGIGRGIVSGDRLLDEAKGFALLGPTAQVRRSHPAPPAFVLEAHRPGARVGLGHLHQSVASFASLFFFRIGDRGR